MNKYPPRGKLGTTGKKFWSKVIRDYELTPSELLILEEICKTLDMIDRLESTWDGRFTVTGYRGTEVIHPIIPELRMYKNTLKSLIGTLKLPDLDTESVDPDVIPLKSAGRKRPMTRSESSRIANTARWDRYRREHG